MVARLGGDEFVVVLDRPMSVDAAVSAADQLLSLLREQLTIGGHSITRTVSIGVAVGIRDETTTPMCFTAPTKLYWRPSEKPAIRLR